MSIQKKRRMVAFFVLSVFLLGSLFAASPLVEHVDHDCTGYDCSVCLQLHSIQHLFKLMATGILGSGALYAGLYFLRILLQKDVFGTILLTPVTLKVRMDN